MALLDGQKYIPDELAAAELHDGVSWVEIAAG